MTRQILNRGTTANDGTGDTLRAASLKIEQALEELYLKLGGDSTVLMPKISFDSNHLIFEGSTEDAFEMHLKTVDPTADRFLSLPDHTGLLISDSATQTLTNKTIVHPTLVQPYIAESADAVHTFHIHAAKLTGYRDINLPALTDSDEFTFNNHTQVLSNKTLTAPFINNPKIGTEIQDSNGNQYIEFTRTVGAVNHIGIANATNSNNPTISAEGADNHIDLALEGKGDGSVLVGSRFRLFTENRTTSGAASLNSPMTMFNAGSGLNITIANGTERGEHKYLVNVNTGTAVVTFAASGLHGGNYSQIDMPTYSSVTLVWTGSGGTWVVMNNQGATLS